MLFVSFQPFVNAGPAKVRWFSFLSFFSPSFFPKSYNPNEIPSRREVIGLMHYAGTRSRERQAVVVRKMERTERVRRGFSCATRVTS